MDCLIFLIMEKRGIREAWAVDEDFTHRFAARPGPRPKQEPAALALVESGAELLTGLISGLDRTFAVHSP